MGLHDAYLDTGALGKTWIVCWEDSEDARLEAVIRRRVDGEEHCLAADATVGGRWHQRVVFCICWKTIRLRVSKETSNKFSERVCDSIYHKQMY